MRLFVQMVTLTLRGDHVGVGILQNNFLPQCSAIITNLRSLSFFFKRVLIKNQLLSRAARAVSMNFAPKSLSSSYLQLSVSESMVLWYLQSGAR
jgi:hypothetical protein